MIHDEPHRGQRARQRPALRRLQSGPRYTSARRAPDSVPTARRPCRVSVKRPVSLPHSNLIESSAAPVYGRRDRDDGRRDVRRAIRVAAAVIRSHGLYSAFLTSLAPKHRRMQALSPRNVGDHSRSARFAADLRSIRDRTICSQ